MINKAILGAFFLMAVMFFATENSLAQGRPIPGEMGGLLGAGNSSNGNVTNSDRMPPRTSGYTNAQIHQMRAQMQEYENQIYQWVDYRDQTVAPYYYDPTYYVWARSEYQRANQAISALQQKWLYYQNQLRQAGIY